MNRFQKWLFLVMVLWAVPSWFLWLGIGMGTSIWRDRQTEKTRESLRAVLDRFTASSDPEVFLQGFSEELLAGLARIPVSSGELVPAARRAILRLPGNGIDLFLFDASGACIFDTKGVDRSTLEEFFGCLRRPFAPTFDPPGPQLEGKKLLGLPCTDMLDVLRPLGAGRILALEPCSWDIDAPDWGFLGLASGSSPDTIGGLFVVYRKSGLTPGFFHDAAMAAATREGVGLGYWFDRRRFHAPPEIPPQEFLELVELFRSLPSPRIEVNGRLLEGRFTNGGGVVLTSAPRPSQPDWMPVLCFLLFAPLSFRFLVLLFRSALLDQPLPLSLGNKVVALFLLALVFPLAVASGMAAVWLREKADERRSETQAAAFRSLENLDAGFERFLAGQELLYRSWCRDFSRGNLGRDALCDQLKSQADRALADDALLIDLDGKPVGMIRHPITANSRRLRMVPLAERRPLLKRLLEKGLVEDRNVLRALYEDLPLEGYPVIRFNPDRDDMFTKAMTLLARELLGGFQPPSGKPEISIAGFLTEDLRSLLEGVKANQGRLFMRSGSKDQSFHFAETLSPASGGSPLLLLLTISSDSLQQEFLQRFFQGHGPEANGERLLAIGYPAVIPRSFPGFDDDLPFRPILRRLAGRGQDRIVVPVIISGRDWEACILKARNLGKYSLVRLIPHEEYAREERRRGWAVLAFLSGFLGFGLLAAGMFRRTLMVPLDGVAVGLEAIRDKRYEHRIPVLSADELGQLCREFNHAIEHLREMEAAKVIQDSLYPQEELIIGGFRISGRNRMTQAIGGDYFDVFPLPDGHCAFILGDVSGHGVSAALVTAMAKAAFTILLPRPGTDPTQVLARISESLLAIVNKKKMMTCVLGVLDPLSGKATIFNAGQCFPLIVPVGAETGAPAFLELSSSPLGLIKKFRSASAEVDLQRHALILYSDGLIEATDASGQVVGYEAFSRIAADLARPGGALTLDDLFARVRALTDPIPWSDDATLLIVQPLSRRL